MGIWFLEDLHGRSGGPSGYREATLRAWESGKFACTVHAGRLLERPMVLTAENAPEMFAAIEGCAVAVGGALEMRPSAPWAGFSVAAGLGIAVLEYLVEADPATAARGEPSAHERTAVERAVMTARLFEMLPALREIASPLSIAAAAVVLQAHGLRETARDGRFHVVRPG